MQEDKQLLYKEYGLTRFMKKFFLHLATNMPFITGLMRAKLCKLAKVKILNTNNTSIGCGVIMDMIHPEDITIGENTIIAPRVGILTHFASTEYRDFVKNRRGKVVIGSNVFIGMDSLIVKPVTIGEGAIIGAASVVVCDIPPYTVWSGNPAKYIKDRGTK